MTVPVCIIEGSDSRTAGLKGYIPQLLKFQVFRCIMSILKELYCITEAALGVLKISM